MCNVPFEPHIQVSIIYSQTPHIIMLCKLIHLQMYCPLAKFDSDIGCANLYYLIVLYLALPISTSLFSMQQQMSELEEVIQTLEIDLREARNQLQVQTVQSESSPCTADTVFAKFSAAPVSCAC